MLFKQGSKNLAVPFFRRTGDCYSRNKIQFSTEAIKVFFPFFIARQ